MGKMGEKIAHKRKDLGMTQIDFADKLSVTRQTVSRWEAGSVMPDIDKISDIASLLNVSCDYLLKDEITDEQSTSTSVVSRLISDAKGKTVKINFFEEEIDMDLYDKKCRIVDFEGNWMNVEVDSQKGKIEKLISISSILSLEILKEEK